MKKRNRRIRLNRRHPSGIEITLEILSGVAGAILITAIALSISTVFATFACHLATTCTL
jgi:hypothetical protein